MYRRFLLPHFVQLTEAKELLKKVEKAPKVDEDDDKVLADAKKLYEEIKNE